ncbi:Gfo/Idh/MocA family protein [Virgibacillus ndiopensis]|uniref:Gfo/Idh/MocA family protein n=1 Tax=Virgibacillus ndiopensis TaxID=2004408 RepID=UPI000C08476A|nr:Gfo/Idh/MocA family oxidoreductase [Virgibacillus ndiopensis]
MGVVRWGVLSTAGIAQEQLLPAFQRTTNAEVVAIASESGLARAKEVAEKFTIKTAYDSYEALLEDASVDAVYIPLPNHLHKKWVIEAAKHGKHILCEKPAALHSGEVMEMKKVCVEHHVIFMEAFMYYFHPQHERVREIIASAEIGDVSFIRAAFSFPLQEKANNIRMSSEKGGGSLYDIGCYTVHSIRNVLNTEPETVQAHGVIDPDYNVDTDVVAYLTFPNGVRAMFDVSFGLVDRSEYEVIGTKGRIVVPRPYRPDQNGGEGSVVVEKKGVTRTETIVDDQYRKQVEHISEAILNGTQVRHDFTNTLNNMLVIDACLESIHTKKQITLGQ